MMHTTYCYNFLICLQRIRKTRQLHYLVQVSVCPPSKLFSIYTILVQESFYVFVVDLVKEQQAF